MGIQQELEDLKYINLLIASIECELKKHRELLYSLPGILAEIERDTAERIQELKQQSQKTLELINKLESSLQVNILIERYLHGKKWEEIALDLSYSKSNLFREHGKAIKNLEQLKQLECSQT
ncbi:MULTISPECIES: hypothetical protein [Streptococcus]|uniref:DUF1492 domain-containing protein n=1 Tax=Streptococcus caledonicus TaxID=2614158 RepID=A0ABW0UAT0_9STRE|nr:hypothetical protein [Streptococcus sp. S784/96/1]